MIFLLLFASMLVGAAGVGFLFGRYVQWAIGPRCAGCRTVAARAALEQISPRRRLGPLQ